MKRRSLPLLVASDFTGFVLVAAAAIVLGVTVNALRPQPLPLFSFDSSPPEQDAALPEITLDALQAAIDRHDSTLIDARPVAFYQLGHLPGAINLPLTDLQSRTADLPIPFPQDATLIVYCQDVSCTAARSEGRILKKLGYRHVILFSGGWYIWHKAGLPAEGHP